VSVGPTDAVGAPIAVGAAPPWRNVGELVREAARRFGAREFLRLPDRSLTFAEVDEATSRIARVLRGRGVEPGDRVALMLPNDRGWPLSWLAILKAGAIVVPVNMAYREADLAFVLEDAGAVLAVTVAERLDLFAAVAPRCPALREVLTFAEVEAAAAAAPAPAPAAADGPRPALGDLANLQYTSGTTGFPKACMLSHDYWLRLGSLAAAWAELRGDDVVLTAQPYSYIDPQWNTIMCLIGGVPLVVLPRFSASGLWPSVREHGVTLFYVLGTMPLLLYKQPPSEQDRDHRVRLVLCSGVVPALHAALEERWGAPWREAYGLTESGIDLCVPAAAGETVGSGVVGRPVATKEVRIVDPDGRPLPDGEPGEIATRGAPMMLGYWNRPEATADTLVDGWLRTGDLGVRDEQGWFRVVGRIKDMVRRGGENVSCAEVEGVIAQHPAVLSAALLAVPDEALGEEGLLVVLPRDGAPRDAAAAEALHAFAAERLARFKLPRYVRFVDRMPLTPSGRVAKRKLVADRSEPCAGAFDIKRAAWR